jgi:membrane peptidoglycan carboxypeptidase
MRASTSTAGWTISGCLRAGLANFGESRSQGASTITMQVARNFYLPTEKTFTRKIYEILLAMKIESLLSKDQILELYMNQIFLGQRAYGFAAACDTYFRQAHQGHHGRRGGHAGRVAQGAVGLQPGAQPPPGHHSPAVHH